MEKDVVAVLGGGNGGHAVAANLSLAGFKVNFFELPQFADSLERVFRTKEIRIEGVSIDGTAKLNLATADIQRAIKDAEVIFVITLHSDIKPWLRSVLLTSRMVRSSFSCPGPGAASEGAAPAVAAGAGGCRAGPRSGACAPPVGGAPLSQTRGREREGDNCMTKPQGKGKDEIKGMLAMKAAEGESPDGHASVLSGLLRKNNLKSTNYSKRIGCSRRSCAIRNARPRRASLAPRPLRPRSP
jgi:hypothetical protein